MLLVVLMKMGNEKMGKGRNMLEWKREARTHRDTDAACSPDGNGE